MTTNVGSNAAQTVKKPLAMGGGINVGAMDERATRAQEVVTKVLRRWHVPELPAEPTACAEMCAAAATVILHEADDAAGAPSCGMRWSARWWQR